MYEPTVDRTEAVDSVEGETVTDLLGALRDEHARAILQATCEEPKTATELVEECDLPSSTVYRKLDRLSEVGLLDEQVTVPASGKRTRRYTLGVDAIRLSLADDSVDVQVARRSGIISGPGSR